MFCNACGNKLSKEDKKCRACGAPADQSESCGGFWGLIGKEPPREEIVVPVTQPVKKPDQPMAPAPVEQKKSPMTLWYGLVAVLALLLLVQTIRVGMLNGDVQYQKDQARTYREWYTQASQENDLLKEQLDNVTGGLQTLQDDVAQIKEILEPEETTEPQEPEETEPENPDQTEPDSTQVPEETEVPEETAEPEQNAEDTQPAETTEETE